MKDRRLPDPDTDAVKTRGRDLVAAQEFLELVAIIRKAPESRTDTEKLVYEYYQTVYQSQLADQTQAALDEYLKWSALSESNLADDPIASELNKRQRYDCACPRELHASLFSRRVAISALA